MMNLKSPKQTETQKKIKRSDFFQKIYILIPIFSVLLTVWTTLFSCFIDFFTSTKTIQLWSILVIFLLSLPIIFLSVVKAHYDRILKDDIEAVLNEKSQALYVLLIKAFRSLSNKKHKRLVSSINQNNVIMRSEPNNQIVDIFGEIQRVLSYIMSTKSRRMDNEDFFIHMIYRYDDSSEWKLIEVEEGGVTLERLIAEKSFFRFLLNHDSDYLFYNSKQELLEVDHYLIEPRDEKENNVLKGSILGYKFKAIGTNEHNVTALLFVSLFSTSFVEVKKKDKETKKRCKILSDNIKDVILHQFDSRLSVELCNLYINDYLLSIQSGNNENTCSQNEN